MTTPVSATILTPARGDVVRHHGQETWVYVSCDAVNVAYVCLTHQLDFPTRHHCIQHTKAMPGEHAIVRWCPKHGLEAAQKAVPPSPPSTPASTREAGDET